MQAIDNISCIAERWVPVKGFEEHYEISDHGRVRSLSRVVKRWWGNGILRSRILRDWSDKDGYRMVAFSKDGKVTTYKVHRLVAQHFVANPENSPQTNHIDLNKANNHWQNLEWVTALKNTRHARDNGRHAWSSGARRAAMGF